MVWTIRPASCLPGWTSQSSLTPEPVGLRGDALAELEALEGALGERAAAAFGQERDPAHELDAGLEVGAGLAVALDALVVGDHAADAALAVVEELRARRLGQDVDPQLLGLLRQPAADIAEADDVVALVVHLRRRGQADGAGLGEIEELVLPGRGLERGALLLPVRDQLGERARLDHRTGEDVRPHLRALLEHADGDLPALLRRELAQPDRRRQAGRAGADDHDVVGHRLAFHALLPSAAPLVEGQVARTGRG